MSGSEIQKRAEAKEYKANLYEITLGDESWVVMSNSYAEVAKYVDLVFRLADVPSLKIKRLELFFRIVMDLEPAARATPTPLYLAIVQDEDSDTEEKVLANSIDAILATVDETNINSISLYLYKCVVLSDVRLA